MRDNISVKYASTDGSPTGSPSSSAGCFSIVGFTIKVPGWFWEVGEEAWGTLSENNEVYTSVVTYNPDDGSVPGTEAEIA